tara:strand:- start:2091 stop:2492 length:402 start_codon:yes stop_codon:yes gene_type:complete
MSFLKKISSSFLLLASLVFLSGLISVYDNVMNVVFYEDLPRTEQNPVASWIISKAGVAGLVQTKAITTMIAVVVMLSLIKTKYRVVILPVFLFQLCLFFYLTFYTVGNNTFFISDWGRAIKLFIEFYQGKHLP